MYGSLGLGTHGSGAGSEKDPSAAVRGLVALGRLRGKEDHAGQQFPPISAPPTALQTLETSASVFFVLYSWLAIFRRFVAKCFKNTYFCVQLH